MLYVYTNNLCVHYDIILFLILLIYIYIFIYTDPLILQKD